MGLMVLEKKIILDFPIVSPWELMTPGANLGPSGMVGRIYVGDH